MQPIYILPPADVVEYVAAIIAMACVFVAYVFRNLKG